jgi:hypothetical protein
MNSKKNKSPIITFDDLDADFDPGIFLSNLAESGLSDSLMASSVFKTERLDVPRAANFMEFCQSPAYLNFPAFPRMLQIASHLLGEVCYFCSDKDYMYQMYDQSIGEINERIVFTRFSKCPKCGRTRFDFIKNNKWLFPESLIAVLGQRSGKNYLLGQLACYQLHRFITLERDGQRIAPNKYFRTGPGMLTMTFTAATLGQAMRNIWNVFQPMVKASPWFDEYFKYLRYAGKKVGEELLLDNATFLRFRSKLIDVACQAPDQRTLRGPTRIGFGMDEIAWHDAKVEENSAKKSAGVLGSAEDIWTSLNNSLRTVRNAAFELMKAGEYDTPTAYDWSISSPCHSNDIGMRRLRLAETNPRIFGAHYATWEVNPEFKDGKNSFASDYAVDEVKADRDFGAIPPLTISPWITDPKPILQAVRAKQERPIITYEQRTERSVFGNMTSWLELKSVNDSSTARILSIDNGFSNNAFAITLSSLDKLGRPYIDQCCMLKPNDQYNINLSKMWDNFIYPIIAKTNITLILYDRWNSIQNIQKLQDEGRDARQYSLTPKDFSFFRSKLMNSEVSYPFSEYTPNVFLDNGNSDVDLVNVSLNKPGFALLLQTLTVRQLGGRVVKPLYGDDDIFRTAMLALKFLYDPEIIPKMGVSMQKESAQKMNPNAVISVRMRSGSSGSSTAPQQGSFKSICSVKTRSGR